MSTVSPSHRYSNNMNGHTPNGAVLVSPTVSNKQKTKPSLNVVTVRPPNQPWYIPSSLAASSTLNPIRAIVDRIQLPTHHVDTPLIPLSIGDPTIFGNLAVPDSVNEALVRNIQSFKYNGYAPSVGSVAARKAIAERYSYPSAFYPHCEDVPDAQLSISDVIITSGCSGALCIAIEALCNSGDNILLPRPGFSLYATIAGRNGIEVQYYDLQAHNNWQCDLIQMRSLINSRTKALLVNNPSNPNGSNWSRQHIEDILLIAEEFHLPIISDEVYADMVFEGQLFYPFGAISRTVPILTVGGIAKQFVCPGWRLGWIIIYEKSPFQPHNDTKSVVPSSHTTKPPTEQPLPSASSTFHRPFVPLREGLNNLSQMIVGANTLIQSIIPELLLHTHPDYLSNLMQSLQTSALYTSSALNHINGLQCNEPAGAMYIMVAVDCNMFGVNDDREFAQALLNEENVFVLPGQCFQAKGFVRLVVCAPVNVLEVACQRIAAFCDKHRKL